MAGATLSLLTGIGTGSGLSAEGTLVQAMMSSNMAMRLTAKTRWEVMVTR